MIDMTKWQEIAKANIHTRPATEGRLAGKIVIVTGAAQGFGKGIAEELYAEGATVGIADMNYAGAQAVAEALGVNFYDGELLSLVAKESGYTLISMLRPRIFVLMSFDNSLEFEPVI